MYLLTFTFLVIGVLGIYTQVAAVEAARLAQNQSSIGQAMLTWHKAAMSLAGNILNPATGATGTTGVPGPGDAIGTPGCSLTLSMAAPVSCKYNATKITGITVAGVPRVLVTGAFYHLPAAGSPTYPDIINGYNFLTYQWKSIAYTDAAGDYYLITYVDPAGADGFVSTAAAPPVSLGMTPADLYRQLQNSGVPVMNMGYTSLVGGINTLVTTAQITIGGVVTSATYPIPATIPANSLAIISQPSSCSSC